MEERVGWRDVRLSETQKKILDNSVASVNIFKPMTKLSKGNLFIYRDSVIAPKNRY